MSETEEELKKNLAHYRQVVMYMGANVPIEVLCLPKVIETILFNDGIIRVYDLINRDLTKINGLGKTRREILTSRLDEFLTISI